MRHFWKSTVQWPIHRKKTQYMCTPNRNHSITIDCTVQETTQLLFSLYVVFSLVVLCCVVLCCVVLCIELGYFFSVILYFLPVYCI